MKTIIPVCVSFFLVLVVSCKKDKVPTTYVPDYLKEMLPYQNGQTIRFNGNYGVIDAIISASSGFVTKSACSSCEPYVREEYLEYRFNVGTKPFVKFSVDVRPNVFLGIYSPMANFQSGGGFDFLTKEGIPQPICDGPRQTCLSTLILNGKSYSNVLEIRNGTSADQIIKAYYTVEKGLIGFAYGNGSIYYLDE